MDDTSYFFEIFNDNEIKDLKQILLIPNDNYTCSECDLIPEILDIDYGSGEIEFSCRIHGTKKMSLKKYLLKMARNVYYNKKCSYCSKIQKNAQNYIFDYCLFCKKIICNKCLPNHTHMQTLKLNDLDNKCLKHHNKLYEYFCSACKENICNLCKDHINHQEIISSYVHIPNKEIEMMEKYNNILKREIEILPYIIKINDLIISSQSKYSFNYFHNSNLKRVSNSFIETYPFLKEVKEFREKIKSGKTNFTSMIIPIYEGIKIINFTIKEVDDQKKLLDQFNNLYNTNLNGNEIKIELNDKELGDKGFELLSKIKFPKLEKLKLRNNKISTVVPLINLSSKKTKKIDLSFNKIYNINPLGSKDCDLKGLNELYLNNNLIEDIGIFGIGRDEIFPELKKLNLTNNRINSEITEVKQILNDLKEKLLVFKYKSDNDDEKHYNIVASFSSILTKIEDIEFLNKRFKLKNPNIKNIKYDLIYRGTRDGDKAKNFHDKINGINKTLCVIKCPKGIFGGYTEETWDGENCDKFDNNAFCFSLTLKRIYELIEGQDAIGCNKDYGPIFRFTFLLNDNYFTKKAFCYPKKPHFNVEENKFELSGGEKYPAVIEFEAFQMIFEE